MQRVSEADVLLTVPKYLSNHMRLWVKSILDRFIVEPEDFAVLVLAASAWDDAEKARSVLAKKGTTFLDRFNSPRSRPEIAQLRDARLAFARLMSQLGLGDEEAPTETRARPRIAPRLAMRKGA